MVHIFPPFSSSFLCDRQSSMALFRDRLVPFLAYLILVVLLPQSTAGPSFVNGQTFTDGLAIIDAPSPNKLESRHCPLRKLTCSKSWSCRIKQLDFRIDACSKY